MEPDQTHAFDIAAQTLCSNPRSEQEDLATILRARIQAELERGYCSIGTADFSEFDPRTLKRVSRFNPNSQHASAAGVGDGGLGMAWATVAEAQWRRRVARSVSIRKSVRQSVSQDGAVAIGTAGSAGDDNAVGGDGEIGGAGGVVVRGRGQKGSK